MAKDQAGSTTNLWDEYVRGVRRLGAIVERESTPRDDVTVAEGYRHLARVLYMGLLATHDYGDTENPEIFLAKTPTQLTGGVTSDAIYHECFIDGRRSYRLSGRRGSAPLFEITALNGKIGITDTAAMVDSIREDSLVVVDDRFEITLSAEPKPPGFDGNWMQTNHRDRGCATYLIIRQYSTSISDVRSATFDIAPIEATPPRPPLSPDEIRTALTASVDFTDKLVRRWTSITDGILEGAANDFVIVRSDDTDGLGMPTGHRFATGGFRIAAGEAWVLSIPDIGNAPYRDAPYWGFQLCNYWFEPIDYGASWGHLNKDTATYGSDGSVTIVVSETDPGRPNWLELRGHTIGNAQFRLSRSSAPLPAITAEIVPAGGGTKGVGPVAV